MIPVSIAFKLFRNRSRLKMFSNNPENDEQYEYKYDRKESYDSDCGTDIYG